MFTRAHILLSGDTGTQPPSKRLRWSDHRVSARAPGYPLDTTLLPGQQRPLVFVCAQLHGTSARIVSLYAPTLQMRWSQN